MKTPFAVLALLTASNFCFGIGIRAPDQDARATGRGDAFTATADNPSAIYYNPAAITRLDGLQARIGFYGITLESTVDPSVPGIDADTKYEPQALAQTYLTYKPQSYPLAFGFGLYSPFGFGLEYPDDVPFRTLAKKGRIGFFTINPVFAWQITDTLSVAAGPNFNYARAKLARGVVTPGDEFLFEGSGLGFGLSAGILWQPHRMHSFGVSYRSPTDVDLSGHTRLRIPSFAVPTPFGPFAVPRVEAEQDADLTFEFPQIVIVGYSFRPTPDWNFEVDVDWTDWDHLNSLTLHQKSGDVVLPFNWESSLMYEFGVTRRLPRGLSVSAGYVYSENSIPNQSFNPLIPDSNRHILSLGFGQQLHRISWDVAYQYAYGPHRHIDNGSLGNGTYRYESHALTFSLGYRF